MEHSYVVAAEWILLALVASLISIRFGISVALVEIICGLLGSNIIHLEITSWVDFFASFGAVILTFLAGAEIDPTVLRKKIAESASIGVVSFLLPFLLAMAFAYYVLNWDSNASKIAGIALSTTSVAVVYAVMVETGLYKKDLAILAGLALHSGSEAVLPAYIIGMAMAKFFYDTLTNLTGRGNI